MKPTVCLAETTTPAGDHLELLNHDGHFYLTVDGVQLTTSFAHGAEEELAKLGCAPVQGATKPHVLIGGLGLGYTLAAASQTLRQKGARFTVAEPIPELVRWNKGPLADLHPGLWDDPRVAVHHGDGATLLANSPAAFSVILLATDRGSAVLAGENFEALYSVAGLKTMAAALKQGGVLAIWSASEDKSLEKRLRQTGFDVSRAEAPAAHRGKQKRRHTIWLARNGEYQPQRPSQHT
jgi:spermidine synthase